MKVGDLVTLSAYGKRVERTSWVKLGDVGVVVKACVSPYRDFAVVWSNSPWSGKSWIHEDVFMRRDLKHVPKL